MQPNQLDQDAVNLTKAIRQTESGGNFSAVGKSGEYGAYQFTEPTWNATSSKYGVNVPLKQATPEQQNEVAYRQIKEWKDKGYNVGQVASMWNSGKPDAYLDNSYIGVNKHGASFNVPEYAKKVADVYQSFKQTVSQPTHQTTQATEQNAEQPKDGILKTIAKGIISPVATMLARPIQAGAELLGASAEDVNRVTKNIAGDWVAPVPESFKDVAKDVGRAAQTVALGLPVGGVSQGIKAGLLAGAGSGLESEGTLGGALKGATIGLLLGGAGGVISKVFDVLPKSLTETAFKGLTPEQAGKVLADKSIGTVDNLIAQSRKSINTYGKQIDNLLSKTTQRGAGNDALRKTVLDFPEFNSDKGVEKMLTKVKSLISSTAKAGEERGTILGYIDKIKNGTATLYEKNKVRSAIDSATSGGYSKLAKSLNPSAGHDLAMTFANNLRNEVQSWVPDTQPIFKEFAKEINIQKALEKSIKKKGGLIRWSDLIPFLAGSGVAGPLGGAGAVLAERAANNPAVQFAAAKTIQGAGKTIVPTAVRGGLLSGLSGYKSQ